MHKTLKATIFLIKRFMGRRYNEVQSEIKTVPYKVVSDSEGLARVDVRGKHYTPQEISAFVLQKLKKSAEAYLGQTIEDAVITVPLTSMTPRDRQQKMPEESQV